LKHTAGGKKPARCVKGYSRMREHTDDEVLLTRKQASGKLKVCLTVLDRLPIARVRIGRSVRYRKMDLFSFIDSRIENAGGAADE